MTPRASISEARAAPIRSLRRIESLAAEIERSLDVIEARLVNLKVLRTASSIRPRKARYHA